MKSQPVIAIFDIGKTNKKCFLFNEAYELVHEQSRRIEEISDEDDFPCDDLQAITSFMREAIAAVQAMPQFRLKAINFSGYGASFVHIDASGHPVTPLYNYLKPFPQVLQQDFYARYGGEEAFSKLTASPVLGSLNSGMQILRIKKEKPAVYAGIRYSLHLPQYLSFVFTGEAAADLTSIGCHTNLWDFTKSDYHQWVYEEGIDRKFPPIKSGDSVLKVQMDNEQVAVGIGLHDSSAALIPYLVSFPDPFALLSTGTWCITLNPFNSQPLSLEELRADCLCYCSYTGQPVKASRLFAGHEHDQESRRIASHFGIQTDFFTTLPFDRSIIAKLKEQPIPKPALAEMGLMDSGFSRRELNSFDSAALAYYQLLLDLIDAQTASSSLVLKGPPVQQLFVDGGFSHNEGYMQLLAAAFPQFRLYSADLAQASALGAALAIHHHWNSQSIPSQFVSTRQIEAVKF